VSATIHRSYPVGRRAYGGPWSPAGYADPVPRPRRGTVDVLIPPSTVGERARDTFRRSPVELPPTQRGSAADRHPFGPWWWMPRMARERSVHPERRTGVEPAAAAAARRAATTATSAASSSSVGSPWTTRSSGGVDSAATSSLICSSLTPRCYPATSAQTKRIQVWGGSWSSEQRRFTPDKLRRVYSGMLPCFFGGRVSRLLRSRRSDLTISDRVSCGAITASMYPRSAAR